MSPTAAALALLWIVVIILAFAMAGILQKVRAVERLGVRGSLVAGRDADAIEAIAPGEGTVVSAVLLIEEGCGVCTEVLPHFMAARSRPGAERVRFVVVTNATDLPAYELGDQVHMLADPDLHARLEPGWFPALLIVTPDRIVAAVEPAGSPEAIDELLTRVTARAAAAR